MKELWVLYERSNHDRGGEWDYQNYATNCRAFGDFETAKKAMQDLIKRYATEDNSMFDGEGNIKEFVDQVYYDDEEKDMFEYVGSLLKKLCLGELEKADIENTKGFFVTNYVFAAEICVDNGVTLLMRGDDDGPCNGIDPYVHTNMFIMDDETKDYFFYLKDQFNMDSDFISHLIVDLKKVTIE